MAIVFLGEIKSWFIALDLILASIFSLIVLSRRKRVPSVTLAWILAFFLLPYFGILLYLLLGYQSMSRRKRLKPAPAKRATAQRTVDWAMAHKSQSLDVGLRRLAILCEKLTEFPALSGNRIQVYEEGYETYGAIAQAIRKAKHHIHLEYYIFQPDETGNYFRELLIQKAKQGVECRLLVDHIGSFNLKKSFVSPMLAAGVKVSFFWPVRFSRPWGMHLRNHRKLVVVDGKTGFIGSQNIGNEYLGWKNRKLAWRDTQIQVDGPVVEQLQAIFAEDWKFSTGEDLSGQSYFPPQEIRGSTVIQSLPTGPDEKENALEMILMEMIHLAERRITLVTPYFIPTLAITMALEAASRRGVKVDLIVPRRSDEWIVDLAARSWFRDLIKGGASIYQYGQRFVHAKVVTVDGNFALLGSANMDARSYLLNFECSALIFDHETATQLEKSFDAMRFDSRQIILEELENQSFLLDIRDGALRALSSIL